MAREIVWSENAADDLHAIYEFLSMYSDAKAEEIVGEIIEKAALLESFPFLGRVVPELAIKSIRELIIHQHRIMYSLSNPEKIDILAVRHSARAFSDFTT